MWRKGCHSSVPVSGPDPCPAGSCDVFGGPKDVHGRCNKGMVATRDGVAKCFAAGAVFAVVYSKFGYSDVVAVDQ